MRAPRHWWPLGIVAAAACTRGEPARAPSVAATGAEVAATTFASYDAGAVAGGPGNGRHYRFGRTPTRAEVAAWTTEVGPDGRELPPGHGSVAQGTALYKAKCAMCHNTNGEGMPPVYPALIGRDPKAEGFHFASDPKLVKTIGNYWPYSTTVYDYVHRAMPFNAPGSLTPNETYALVAWLLAENEVIPRDAVMNAQTLPKVQMPARSHFVLDDRRGGQPFR